jgi:hypothetical protein
MTKPHADDLYACLYRIATNDPIYGEIEPHALARLVEWRIVEIDQDGTPRLTPDGERCYIARTISIPPPIDT